MSLETLISIAEDGPWCGTRPPGRPRPHPVLQQRRETARAEQAAEAVRGPRPEPWWVLGPQPDPWRFGPSPDPWVLGAVEIGLYGAISLHQAARLVSGPATEGLRSAAAVLFDDTCGSVPLSELIWLLLHRPPPPPPQWLNVLTFAGETLAFAQATQQEELAKAANRQIAEGLRAFGLDAK